MKISSKILTKRQSIFSDEGIVVEINKRNPLSPQEKSLNRERRILRQYHKQIVVGMFTFEKVPLRYQRLLVRYYGY